MTPVPPLVSVGIPTYNRPEGLLRTLNCILRQTHRRVEIIVSDNCSPAHDVERIVKEFIGTDERVRFFRQENNIGIWDNFRFVLTQATGEYFMWAADDDEWNERFIEQCLAHMGSAVSVMSACTTLWRATGARETTPIPTLHPRSGVYDNLRVFLAGPAPCLFYGLHRRRSVLWVLSESLFDWWDCYFIAKQIAEGGFVTFSDDLYTAGIDSPSYALKPAAPAVGRVFRYRPFLEKVGRLIKCNRRLSVAQKLVLFDTVLVWMAHSFEQFEGEEQPRHVTIVRQLRALRNRVIRVSRSVLRIFSA